MKGDLTVTNDGDAILIRGDITGLQPGKEHGFHVHEFGKCDLPDFKSAGEHFNPTKARHGEHLGDLPNAKADENGHATVDVFIRGPNLVDKDGAPVRFSARRSSSMPCRTTTRRSLPGVLVHELPAA